jgi:RNA polymerase sigma factor FliA
MSYDKDTLILNHLDLAKDIANREWRTATHVLKKDDMLSLAYEGLVDAANRWEPYCLKNEYDPSAVQYFKVFASLRIRGTIRDHIRKEDWATRTLRGKAKKLKDAGQDEGLSVAELADRTGMSTTEIYKVNAKLAARPISLDATPIYFTKEDVEKKEFQLKEAVDTEGVNFANEMLKAFVGAFSTLPTEVKVVLALHYYSKLDLRKVSEELGLAESKISQLHASGVLAVREALVKEAQERD